MHTSEVTQYRMFHHIKTIHPQGTVSFSKRFHKLAVSKLVKSVTALSSPGLFVTDKIRVTVCPYSLILLMKTPELVIERQPFEVQITVKNQKDELCQGNVTSDLHSEEMNKTELSKYVKMDRKLLVNITFIILTIDDRKGVHEL